MVDLYQSLDPVTQGMVAVTLWVFGTAAWRAVLDLLAGDD